MDRIRPGISNSEPGATNRILQRASRFIGRIIYELYTQPGSYSRETTGLHVDVRPLHSRSSIPFPHRPAPTDASTCNLIITPILNSNAIFLPHNSTRCYTASRDRIISGVTLLLEFHQRLGQGNFE